MAPGEPVQGRHPPADGAGVAGAGPAGLVEARWGSHDADAPEARRTMKNPSVTQNVCCAGPSV